MFFLFVFLLRELYSDAMCSTNKKLQTSNDHSLFCQNNTNQTFIKYFNLDDQIRILIKEIYKTIKNKLTIFDHTDGANSNTALSRHQYLQLRDSNSFLELFQLLCKNLGCSEHIRDGYMNFFTKEILDKRKMFRR